MKVETNRSLAAAYGTPSRSTRKDDEVQSGTTGATDSVAINPLASQISAVERSVASEPAFDAGKVEAIRSAIAAGTFEVNPGAIADGLIASARELLGR
ncbi:flagellar biosynthesis anti-sigma factor FlgM [Crenobacter sp. SG2303]|uniref:Negative regulator of flagellin synthesis n=1 Tax=Crenobacter oryzisoli TaxID=3056844 RepID=A0ABT7XHS0_9NEIS|nr:MULTISPECIES: flagellar biosynthesis anti-sigma factor FlgM [unclassified Crenobacter]MDN0073322.1 flagellar biosynthesis anti-sigma factor FlgM [Crenobacter sp. SG2303]MDN0084403.1 flagellar biosynthesis anti-sigma factor FlgM [Crenobacter sp. SG2305]